MKKRFTEAQITGFLREAEVGRPIKLVVGRIESRLPRSVQEGTRKADYVSLIYPTRALSAPASLSDSRSIE